METLRLQSPQSIMRQANDIELQEIVHYRTEEKTQTRVQFQQSIALDIDKLRLFIDKKIFRAGRPDKQSSSYPSASSQSPLKWHQNQNFL